MAEEDKKEDGTYDVLCNGIKADLKRTQGSGNIVKYANYAVKEQGAIIVLFEFSEWKAGFRDAVSEMIRKKIHGFYYIAGKGELHGF